MNRQLRRRAVVVVRHGLSSERGRLALRTALALGLGGHDVSVLLHGPAAAFAAPNPEAGDRGAGGARPGAAADLDALVRDLGSTVGVVATGRPRVRAGVQVVAPGEAVGLHRGASLVVVS